MRIFELSLQCQSMVYPPNISPLVIPLAVHSANLPRKVFGKYKVVKR